jgi:glycosyltransferase involved in cell wall biosynthesis
MQNVSNRGAVPLCSSAMSPIRVQRVIARMNIGGPARQVAALVDDLPDTFTTLLSVGVVEADEEELLALDTLLCQVERVPALKRSLSAVADARALAALVASMRRFRPHIVHTHTAKAGALGRVAARLCGVPVVVHTFHGHLLEGYFPGPTTKAIVLAERALATQTGALIAVGERVRDELLQQKIGRPGQYTVVPPGIEPGDMPGRDSARRAFGVDPNQVVVGFVGRLAPIKRPDRMIEVARRVIQRFPNTVFLVVGDGTMAETTRQAASDLGDSVRFLGWRRDVASINAAIDIALVTSDNEGMPVALIEAAHAGVPAVTSDVGSCAEVVVDGMTGYVRSPNAEQLAGALCPLVADAGLRHRFGAAARVRAQVHFSRRRLVSDVARLYVQLLDGAGRPVD